MKPIPFCLAFGAILIDNASGFVAPSNKAVSFAGKARLNRHSTFHLSGINKKTWEVENDVGTFDPFSNSETSPFVSKSAATVGALALFTALPANAVSSDPLPSALFAYAHYLSILSLMGVLMYERLTVAPDMDPETEKKLVLADGLYGIVGLTVLISGYYRAVEYGKGFDFYKHEPIFWVKMAALGLFGGLSLFPTITLLKRGIPLFQGEKVEPMSEKLAKRMKSVMNAEISALLSIPLFASLMSRGVAYNNDFPPAAGYALVAVTLLGSGFLYAKQALTWTEE